MSDGGGGVPLPCLAQAFLYVVMCVLCRQTGVGFLTKLFSEFSRNTKLAKILPCFAKLSRVTFNGQRIVGLCKSLMVNAVNFLKVGNGSRLTAFKPFLTMSMYHKYR
jgi:hypothetical protein